MSKLSTHVLDTSIGKPAQGVKIELYRVEGSARKLIKSVVSNEDGRTDELLLDADSIQAAEYEIVFQVGDYFANRNAVPNSGAFLNHVPIRFTIANPDQNYHVPLVVTPWSYSTYRGS